MKDALKQLSTFVIAFRTRCVWRKFFSYGGGGGVLIRESEKNIKWKREINNIFMKFHTRKEKRTERSCNEVMRTGETYH